MPLVWTFYLGSRINFRKLIFQPIFSKKINFQKPNFRIINFSKIQNFFSREQFCNLFPYSKWLVRKDTFFSEVLMFKILIFPKKNAFENFVFWRNVFRKYGFKRLVLENLSGIHISIPFDLFQWSTMESFLILKNIPWILNYK